MPSPAHRARETRWPRGRPPRRGVDGRAAGVAEAEVAGDLVEGLAGRVVDRGAEHAVPPVALHQHEQRVPAGHEQDHEGQLEVGLLQQRGVEVGLEVVDGDERHVPRQGQRLGRRHADQERPDQPGTVGGGHGVDLAPRRRPGTVGQPRLDEGLGHHRHDEVDVGPAGDLGHDAAVAGVEVDLAADHRRQHGRAPLDDRGGGLVAGGLDPQDPAAAAHVGHRSGPLDAGPAGNVGGEPAEPLGVGGGVDVVGPHHDGVLLGLDVVALAHAGGREAEPRGTAPGRRRCSPAPRG